eukprot:jgi/Mesen1/8546/ME000484S07930
MQRQSIRRVWRRGPCSSSPGSKACSCATCQPATARTYGAPRWHASPRCAAPRGEGGPGKREENPPPARCGHSYGIGRLQACHASRHCAVSPAAATRPPEAGAGPLSLEREPAGGHVGGTAGGCRPPALQRASPGGSGVERWGEGGGVCVLKAGWLAGWLAGGLLDGALFLPALDLSRKTPTNDMSC